ncbi:hypothetical protein RIF29_29211 [Crotalaria pallida]|uniref:Uncharacterized protein n=1 Tax=Crotalaria pallida TaxID=3830 RepID=A0AAN9I059_CROPI
MAAIGDRFEQAEKGNLVFGKARKSVIGANIFNEDEIDKARLKLGSSSDSDAFAYATLMDSLVDRNFLFKVCVKVGSSSQSPPCYSIRRLSEIENNDMFQLMFHEDILSKAMYSPIMPLVEVGDIETRAHRANNPDSNSVQEIHFIRRNLIGDFESANLATHDVGVDSTVNYFTSGSSTNKENSPANDTFELQLMSRGME